MNAGASATRFRVGDRVRWNSEAGSVSGVIVRVHTQDTMYKGCLHHCSADDPQYEIQSDRSDHVAMHKGRALTLVQRGRRGGAAAALPDAAAAPPAARRAR